MLENPDLDKTLHINANDLDDLVDLIDKTKMTDSANPLDSMPTATNAPTPTEQLHVDIRDAASPVPGVEETSSPGLIQEVIGNIPGTPVPPATGYGDGLHPPVENDPHREMVDALWQINSKLDHVLEHMHRAEEHHAEVHCCQDTASAGSINLDVPDYNNGTTV
tara:strand:- start:608 stop:1099 length:492 start_codon:yes stop_codon:yes gene_type:complete